MNKNPKYEHLTAYKWEKGKSGNMQGRPESYVTVLKELGYTKPVIATMVAEMMFMPLKDIYEITNRYSDNEEPAIRIGIATSFRNFARNGEYRYIADLMNIVFGKHLPYIPDVPPAEPKNTHVAR